jgi:hypothetical protein
MSSLLDDRRPGARRYILVLNYPPELAHELALGELFVDGRRVIPRLNLYKPASNCAFQIARVGAPIEIGRLAIDQHVKQFAVSPR